MLWLGLCSGLGFGALDHGGPNLDDEMTDTELEKLLDLARRSRGWVFRDYPPQRARLRGNCELIVVPAWLWRPRPHIQHVMQAEVIPMRRVG